MSAVAFDSLPALACAAMVAWTAAATATEELPFEEEAAMRAAVEAIEPSVVRLETAGVSAAAVTAAGEVNPASGPSTALVVDEGGWLLATAFAETPAVSSLTTDGSIAATAARIAASSSKGMS